MIQIILLNYYSLYVLDLTLQPQKSRKDKNRIWHFYFVWYSKLENLNENARKPISKKTKQNKILAKLTGEEGDDIEGS